MVPDLELGERFQFFIIAGHLNFKLIRYWCLSVTLYTNAPSFLYLALTIILIYISSLQIPVRLGTLVVTLSLLPSILITPPCI